MNLFIIQAYYEMRCLKPLLIEALYALATIACFASIGVLLAWRG